MQYHHPGVEHKPVITAVDPASQDQRWRAVKECIAKGDKAAAKAEDFYITAGQHLKALKAEHTGTWAEWKILLKEKCGIGKSRASELMQIADGTKTVEGIREATAKKVRQIRARKSSPVRTGENADDPEASAEGMKAQFAEGDADDGDSDEVCWRRGLMYRATNAIGDALFEDWSQFPIDPEIVETVARAAAAWAKLDAYLKELQHRQQGDGIPDFLRRDRGAP
jgi:hypothetical protein